MDENMKKWPQTETGSQTGTFTLFQICTKRSHFIVFELYVFNIYVCLQILCKYIIENIHLIIRRRSVQITWFELSASGICNEVLDFLWDTGDFKSFPTSPQLD